ncbi:MAG: DUF4392 domain-containing protein [SAR324 cluster bacterium]|nr:DUF4392 domain-containing protein [SAR324 cluster bacterium]
MLHFHENIDRAVTIEMRPRGVPRGVNLQAYHYVRATGPPLSHQIAHALLAQPGSHIGFLTGMVFPPHLPHGEIDGPIGSAVLGHSLSQLGHPVSILVEEPVLPVMEALVQVLGADRLRLINASAVDDGDWDAVADDLGVVIAIEKLGVNRKGQRHLITGTPFDPGYPYADHVVNRLNDQRKLTIGFGDGGNEVGFGAIFDFARAIVPHGRECGCPCEDGTITSTATRYLFPAASSNLGAYGVAAALALQTGRFELLPDPENEMPLLEAALEAGAIDGGTGRRIAAEDGIPGETAVGVLRVLNTIVRMGHQDFERAF